MGELQTDDAVGDDVTQTDLTPADTGTDADLAPATGDNQEEKTESTDQDAVQKVINKKHWEAREAERKAEAAEQKAKELEDRLKALEAPKEPTVPDEPDPYSESYEQELRNYREAVAAKARFDAANEYTQQQQQLVQQQQQEAEQQRVQSLINGFNERTVKLGLSQEVVNEAANKVVQYGIDPGLGQYIMSEDEGPLILAHLAQNPMEIDKLRSMSLPHAAVYVSTTIKQGAASLKPKVSSAPEPTEVLSGNGAPDKVSPNLRGAKFE